MTEIQLTIGEILEQSAPPDVCRRKHGGNAESEAANLVTNKARDRARIISLLKDRDWTCDELEVATQMSHQTCSARLSELLKDGVAIRTGTRRPTRTGAQAGVVRLK